MQPYFPHSGTVPVTPVLFALKIHVPLPIVPVLAHPTTGHQPVLLATRLLTPLDAWATSLWHEIWPHAHTDHLQQAILHWIPIQLVSDATISLACLGT